MYKTLILTLLGLSLTYPLGSIDPPTIETEPASGELHLFLGHQVEAELVWEYEALVQSPDTTDQVMIKLATHQEDLGLWATLMMQARLQVEDETFLAEVPWLSRPPTVPFTVPPPFTSPHQCVVDPVQLANSYVAGIYPETPDQPKNDFMPLLLDGNSFPRSNWRIGAPGTLWAGSFENWWLETLARDNLTDDTDPNGSKATFSSQALAKKVMAHQALTYGWTEQALADWFDAGGFESALNFGLIIDVQALAARSPAINPAAWPPAPPYPGFPNWGSGGSTPGWRLSNPVPIYITPRPFEVGVAPWWTLPMPASLANAGNVKLGRNLVLRASGFTGQSTATVEYSNSSTAVLPVRYHNAASIRINIPTTAPLGAARILSLTNDFGTSTFGFENWNQFTIIP